MENCQSKADYMALWDMPLAELTAKSKSVKDKYCGNKFKLCTIVNGKSGLCSEDCKYCAQSIHCSTGNTDSENSRAGCGGADTYPLMSTEDLVQDCAAIQGHGIARYAIVTSGRKLNAGEIDSLCTSFRALSETYETKLCSSNGLLNYDELVKLRDSGITRYHNNLESSRRYFPQICTTHTYDEKIETIRAAKKAGLFVCSGGIIGLGETREVRVDMAMTVKALGVDSVPLNILNPIPGTPLYGTPALSEEEILRTFCIFRIILEDRTLRLAGGRIALPDRGREIIRVAANAAITGDMLTTAGISIENDLNILNDLGLTPVQED